jgi:hypothetical protein
VTQPNTGFPWGNRLYMFGYFDPDKCMDIGIYTGPLDSAEDKGWWLAAKKQGAQDKICFYFLKSPNNMTLENIHDRFSFSCVDGAENPKVAN